MSEFQIGRIIAHLGDISKQLKRIADTAEELVEATKIGGPLDLRNLVQREGDDGR